MPAMSSQGAKQPITVVIADDHRSFGEALEVALDKERDLKVIEVVTDGRSAIESATKEHPDVVLMDLQMPGVDGIEATRRIHDESTGTAVIILSGQEEDEVGLAREGAAREVRRYVQSPTQPFSYLIGFLQIEALRDELMRREGAAFDEKAFHDRLLGFGSIPIALIREAMLE